MVDVTADSGLSSAHVGAATSDLASSGPPARAALLQSTQDAAHSAGRRSAPTNAQALLRPQSA